VLHLGENQLSGSIPPALGELASLEMLTLYRNRLTDSCWEHMNCPVS